MRDEFSAVVISALAKRVGHRCSNPSCRIHTSGPHLDVERSVNIGVAAHITAASQGGPRFDPSLTPDERSDIRNAIWLCQVCGKLVDNDTSRFTAEVLRQWKTRAEADALQAVGGTPKEDYYPPGSGRAHTPIPRIYGLDYEVAREALINAGWQPALHHWKDGEKFTYGSGKYLWDKGYREIIDASGTGLAHMWFRFRDVHGNDLIVMTAGETVDENGGAAVWRWYFDPEQELPRDDVSRRFEGEVGQLDRSIHFVNFIYRNVGQIVWIDIFMDERDFRGAYSGDSQFFVLYDKLWRAIAVGEDFGSANATGVEFNFKVPPATRDCAFYPMRGFVRLSGHFAVIGTDGPHQGLMGVALKPLNVEDVPGR